LDDCRHCRRHRFASDPAISTGAAGRCSGRFAMDDPW
jgi:hypothetical protein